ncbi:MAG: enoyl-CoA hydratase/isomerase family protein [Caulobacteraceae bacterium]
MSEVLEFIRQDALFDVVLNDSAGGNLISNEDGDRIAAALAALDAEVKLVRIRTDGQDFCRGRVSLVPKPGTAVLSGLELKQKVAEPALRVYEALRNVPVPVLSVVRGAALGYGCGLVAASDITLASDAAEFQVPELERNIPPTLVMTALMGRIPHKAIAHMVLSRDTISAAQALEWGLVTKVLASAELDAEVERLTRTILAYAPESVRAVKEYLRHAPGLSGQAQASLAANIAGTALSSRFVQMRP